MKQIGTDFQGWPVYALPLRNILKELGFTETEDGFVIKKDNPLLDAYPRLLIDDGMAYGVDPQFVTEADPEIYDREIKVLKYVENKESEMGFDEQVATETIKVFNMFRDRPEPRLKTDDE